MITKEQQNGLALEMSFSGAPNFLPWFAGYRFVIATATAPGSVLSPPLLSVWAKHYRAGADLWTIWNIGATTFDVQGLNIDSTVYSETLAQDDVLKLGLSTGGFWLGMRRVRLT